MHRVSKRTYCFSKCIRFRNGSANSHNLSNRHMEYTVYLRVASVNQKFCVKVWGCNGACNLQVITVNFFDKFRVTTVPFGMWKILKIKFISTNNSNRFSQCTGHYVQCYVLLVPWDILLYLVIKNVSFMQVFYLILMKTKLISSLETCAMQKRQNWAT